MQIVISREEMLQLKQETTHRMDSSSIDFYFQLRLRCLLAQKAIGLGCKQSQIPFILDPWYQLQHQYQPQTMCHIFNYPVLDSQPEVDDEG